MQLVTKADKAENKQLELFNLLNSDDFNCNKVSKILDQLIKTKNYKNIYNLMASLEYNKNATKAIEEIVNSKICKLNYTHDDYNYTIRLYFIPISLSILSNEISPNNACQFNIKPSLPIKTCKEINKLLNSYFKTTQFESIGVLSGLLNKDILTSSSGLEFVDGLKTKITHFIKDKNKLNDMAYWLSEFNILDDILLNEAENTDSRILLAYTITPRDDLSLDKKIQRQNCLVNHYLKKECSRTGIVLANKINNLLKKGIEENYLHEPLGSNLTICTLPVQNYSFLKLCDFPSSIYCLIKSLQAVVGEFSFCTYSICNYGIYLSHVSISFVINNKKYTSLHIYESKYQYHPEKELRCFFDLLGELCNITFILE